MIRPMIRQLWKLWKLWKILWRGFRRSCLASEARRKMRSMSRVWTIGVDTPALVSLIVTASRMPDGTFDVQEHGWVYPHHKVSKRDLFIVLKRKSKYDDGSLAHAYRNHTMCLCLFTGNIFYFIPAYADELVQERIT